MANVPEFTSETFDSEVQSGVTLLDFWAEWCGPCKMITPVIEELAAEYQGKAKIAKINVDNEGALAARFEVQSIPTLIVMKDGEVSQRFTGVTPKAKLAEAIDAATA